VPARLWRVNPVKFKVLLKYPVRDDFFSTIEISIDEKPKTIRVILKIRVLINIKIEITEILMSLSVPTPMF